MYDLFITYYSFGLFMSIKIPFFNAQNGTY